MQICLTLQRDRRYASPQRTTRIPPLQNRLATPVRKKSDRRDLFPLFAGSSADNTRGPDKQEVRLELVPLLSSLTIPFSHKLKSDALPSQAEVGRVQHCCPEAQECRSRHPIVERVYSRKGC